MLNRSDIKLVLRSKLLSKCKTVLYAMITLV